MGPLYLNSQLNAKLEPENSLMIYAKGAYVLEMIRLLMEDPRQRETDHYFIDMMHDFVSTYANRNASTADFQRIVEKHMGEPMDWFFNEWVYGTEIPEYTFKYSTKPGEGGKTILQLSLTQAKVSDQFEMRLPLYMTVGKETRRLAFVKIIGSSTAQADVPLPVRPNKVTLDEYHDVLAVEHQ